MHTNLQTLKTPPPKTLSFAPHLGHVMRRGMLVVRRRVSISVFCTAVLPRQQLVELQGPGKSLRVPARNRLMDDLLLQTLQQLAAAGHEVVQVVNIGCGMVRADCPWLQGCCQLEPCLSLGRHCPLFILII